MTTYEKMMREEYKKLMARADLSEEDKRQTDKFFETLFSDLHADLKREAEEGKLVASNEVN